MASTASDLIKFEKMATGEKSGTWGTLANQAMSRLEEAIHGFTNISLNSLGGGNYTLNDTQYTEHNDGSNTSESHVKMIKATGTLNSAEKIIVPLRTHLYLVWNATSGSYAVTVGGGSGDAIEVPQGYLMHVICDGTNCEAAGVPVSVAGVARIDTIELGAATDTTITRASAGDVNVEGNIVYRAGGTDVAIADGGTGAGTASAAFTALKQAASSSATGVVELATDAEGITGTDTGRVMTPANVQAKVASATAKGIAELATTAETVTGTDTARVVTPAGLRGAFIGQQTIWVPAAAMEPAVSTAPATSNAVEIGTSLFAARTMDFATGADDFCYFGIQMPKSWDAGTLVCQFVWSATGTTANTVLWAIAATSLGNDEVLTTAFPTAASPAADTNSTTADDLMISAEVTVTVGSSPTAEDYVIFEVSRDVSGDTLAEDARLHGIKIHYTVDAGIDD